MKAVKWAGLVVAIALAAGTLSVLVWRRMPEPPPPTIGESVTYTKGMVELLDSVCTLPSFAGNWFDCGLHFKVAQPEVYAETCGNQMTSYEVLAGTESALAVTDEMTKLLSFCTYHED